MIGKRKKNSKFEVLMVAQSDFDRIKKEIETDVSFMYNWSYRTKERGSIDLDQRFPKEELEEAKINTNNNKYLYPKKYAKQKKAFLYRYLYKHFTEMKIYEIRIDDYINILPNSLSSLMTDFYMAAKDYYVESKLAFDTEALYWNYYNSGVGIRFYNMFKEQEKVFN